MEETRTGGEAREFPPTRWTAILSTHDDPAARRRALEGLLTEYWKPIYFYVRRKGLDVESAKDAVQGFLLHAIEKDFLSRADPSRGRFRTFLRSSVDHWLINEHERESAQKRGGNVAKVSLDFDVAEREVEGSPATPDAAFEREWALTVMERAIARLRAEFESGLRKGPFDLVLRSFGDAPPSYDVAARESGMSAVRFKAFLHRARVRLREIVREEAAQTVGSAEEADAEVAELLRALRS